MGRSAILAAGLRREGGGPDVVLDDPPPLVAAAGGRDQFVTVVYLVLDPATGAASLRTRRAPAAAVVSAGGTATTSMPRAARRWGSAAPGHARSSDLQLAPGETLWLYTDGLVESRRRPIDVGLAALADAAGRADRGTSNRSPVAHLWSRSRHTRRRRHRAARATPTRLGDEEPLSHAKMRPRRRGVQARSRRRRSISCRRA